MRTVPENYDHSVDLDLSALSEGIRPPDSDVVDLIDRLYGLDVTLSPLDGDRDANYRITTAAGDVRMFKVIHPDEHPLTTRQQDAILEGLATVAPGLPVPRIVRAIDGSASPRVDAPDGRSFSVRMVSFLDGVPVGSLPPGSWNPVDFGRSIGELMTAMARLSSTTHTPPLVWDLMKTRGVLELATEEPPLTDAVSARQVLEEFGATTPAAFAHLPQQATHNDLNPGNVLVDPTTGVRRAFIDFGDSVWGPRIAEVAVALSYLIDADQPVERWDAIGTLRGIRETFELVPQEIDALYDLIAARLAVTIVVARWRARRFPANSEYITRNTDNAVRRLTAVQDAGRSALTAVFAATAPAPTADYDANADANGDANADADGTRA